MILHHLNINDVILLSTSCASSAIIAYTAYRNIKSRRKFKGSVYSDVVGKPLRGFMEGYLSDVCRGRKWFEVRLSNLLVGERFSGPWNCIELGSGGWGTAYLIARGDTRFVIKVPHTFKSLVERGELPTVTEEVLNKVTEEARILSMLNHPHILKLIHYSEVAPLLIYEFADQGTIEWQVNRGWKPTLRDVLILGIQLADALRYIHTRGLIHGDLKASNVFVVEGRVKLGDFSNLKKLLSVTSRTSWSFTPGWRAPEQVYSDLRREVSKLGLEDRIDTYMLGNLLLYLTAGEVIDGEEAISKRRLEDVLRQVTFTPLRDLLGKLLTPKAEERLSAAEAVRNLCVIYHQEVVK